MKYFIFLILSFSILSTQDKVYDSPDYLLSLGVAFGKVGKEDVIANIEASISYDFFEEYENVLLGVALAKGKVDINGTNYDTNEFLAKIDYVPNFHWMFSLGAGIGEYKLNDNIERKTITLMSLSYRQQRAFFDRYVSIDYRLLDLGTNKSEKMVVVHVGAYF